MISSPKPPRMNGWRPSEHDVALKTRDAAPIRA
jgi:hypothetical protein